MEDEINVQPDGRRQKLIALIVSLLVTIIWSSTFVIVKFGLETLGPLTIAGLRYFIGAMILAPFLFFQKKPRPVITKNLWIRLALIGISSYTIGNGALFWGLKYIPATTGSLLMSAIPILVLAGGIILLKEIPTFIQVLGVVLTLIGSGIFFSSGLEVGELKGILIVLIGLVGFAAFSLIGRGIARKRSLDTLTLTTIPLAIGGLTTLGLALAIEGFPYFTPRGILVVAWLAVVNTAIGYWLYNHALRDLTALEMNMVMNLTPIFTGLLSWAMLGEKLVFIQIIGMVVMIVGVILVQSAIKPGIPDSNPSE
jgi:drug/metabolite transporter (DMT)-like permease